MIWTLHPDFVLRVAGFPYDDFAALHDDALRAALQAVTDARLDAAGVRRCLLKDAFPAAVRDHRDRIVLRALSAARRRVGRWRPAGGADALRALEAHALLASWDELLAGLAEAESAALQRCEDAWMHGRRTLHAWARRQPVREAAFLLSPSFATALEAYAARALPAAPTATARLERRLVLYLQRLAAKNETNSFFGPVGYGELDASAAEAISVCGRVGAGPPEVFVTQRLAEGLAAAIARDPELGPHIAPRRSPLVASGGPGLVDEARGRALPTTPAEQLAWSLADGRRSVVEIGRALGDEALGAPVLDGLARARAVVLGPRVDPRTPAPLDDVDALVERLPPSPGRDRWRLELQAVRAGVERFAGGDLPQRAAALRAIEERYEALTGSVARRGAGEAYADRTLVFEERESDLRLRLGAPLSHELGAEIAPALSLWAAVASERAQLAQRRALALFEQRWPAADEVPFPRFLAAAAAAGRDAPAADPQPTPVEHELARLVGTAQGEVRLDPGELLRLGAAPAEPVFVSVDVLIAAADIAAVGAGTHRLVLGEAHAPHLLGVFPTDHFLRRRAPEKALRRDAWLCDLLERGGRRLAQVVLARGSKIFAYRLPVRDIELRPHLPTEGALPAAALVVRRRAGAVDLHDEHGPLTLLPALRRAPGLDPLEAFALPAVESLSSPAGADLPRLTYGRVVLRRRTWRRSLPEAVRNASGVRRTLEAWRWKEELGAPDVVFARVPGEPKPVLVDFASPLSVEALGMLAGRGAGELTLTEMLPGPDELWLLGDRGRHTCELRLLGVLA